MSQIVHDPLWIFEVYHEWALEVHEDHVRYIDYCENVSEIDFNTSWL